MKKAMFWIAIVICILIAIVASIWLLGGRMLWIRIVMNLPIPADWKGVLFGW